MASIVSTYTGTLPRQEKAKFDRIGKPLSSRGALECLIVSGNNTRRETLSRAATESGWSSVVCGDPDTARHMASRIAVKLAIVDLEKCSPADLGGLRDLSAELTRLGGPLLVVCGTDGDAQQEIWARQLGAWLYLPGMAGVDAMATLCGEARQVVEKSNSNGFGH